jgi:hypothetical protein
MSTATNEPTTDEQWDAISDKLQALTEQDPKAAHIFEQEWAFALSAIETGGIKNLIDDEPEEMIAELDILLGS